MNQAPMRTQAEIDQLKHEWQRDPCWDLADTEGFEAHRDELAAFSRAQTVHYLRAERQRLRDKADNLGCSVPLVKYMEALERTVVQLQEFHSAHYYGDPIPTPFYPPRRQS